LADIERVSKHLKPKETTAVYRSAFAIDEDKDYV
jgi:hypothetical protein